jgi:RHS repeat-associated protein
MRRFAALAVLVAALCLFASSITVKQAHASWTGADVDPACPNSTGGVGLAGACPSPGEACNSWALFYNAPVDLVLQMNPIYNQGRLLGYGCLVFYLPIENAGGPTFPDCPSDGSQGGGDPDATSGCSFRSPPNPAQVCNCEDKNKDNNGANDPAGDPVNLAIGDKYETVTDYRSQGSDTLAFIRYYHSAWATTASMGYGWRSSFDRQIVDRFGGALAGSDNVILVRAEGAQYFFSGTVSGGYASNNRNIDGRLATDGATVWTFTDRDDTVETYGYTTGQLLSIRTRSGYQQNLRYDANGNLAGVTDSYGRTLGFTFANGVLTSMTDPDGRVYRYGYTRGLTINANRLSQVTYPDNSRVQYLYEDARFPYALTAIIDEDGNRFASWTYDNGRRANSSQNGNGANLVTMSYNLVNFLGIPEGGAVTVTNALGKQVVHNIAPNQAMLSLTGLNELASASTPAASTRITYDGNGYVASRTDENGNVTQYQNDVRGLVLSKTEAAGTAQQRVTTTTWHPAFHLPTQIVEPGRTTIFTYDASGNLLTKTQTDTTTGTVPYSTNGQTRSWSYTYTAAGQVASMTDPRGNVTTYAYDASGTLVTVTNPLGQTTRVTSHDASGRPLMVVDPNNVTKTLTYDLRGRLISVTVVGATTTIAYDAAGNVIQVTRPDGSFLAYAYDAAHRLIRVSNAFDDRVNYTLDALGDHVQTQIHGPGGATLTKTQSAVFDELGRLIQSIGAAGQTTQFAYDKDDNTVATTDPLGNVTGQSFDALNRLIQTAAPLASTVAYGYDAHDNRTAVSDPRGLVTSYVYDGLDNLIQQSSPDTGVAVYVVDPAGNRVQETDAAGHVVQMAYDALNRVTAKTFPNDPTENVTYSYDQASGGFGIGRLTSVSDESGTTSFIYDARGNVTQETHVIDGVTYATAYAYDLADHVVQVTYPSGRIVTYTRDAMGRVSDIATAASATAVPVAVVSGATYEPFGALTSLAYGNGLDLSAQYDEDYQPSARLVEGAATVQDLSYTLDADGNITAIGDLVTATRSQVFQYDALQRLSFANGLYGQLGYSYDAVGNRLSQTGGTTNLAQSYAYAANSNELLQMVNGGTTRSFTYTAAGNIAQDNHGDGTFLAYSYDEGNRLVQVANQSQVVATYDHDYLGRRVVKDVSGTPKKVHKHPKKKQLPPIVTHLIYDRAGHVLVEADGATGATLKEHLWLEDVPVAMTNSGTLYFVHADDLGTPQKITDASQAVVYDAAFRPFGETQQVTSPPLTNLRFPGQYFDPESGLAQNWFRDYDASVGRYIESDPIGLKGGINTYGYASGDPTGAIDPLGLALYGGLTGEYGGYGFVGGGGATIVRCKDECGKAHWFLYVKICGGVGTPGGSGFGGYVSGLDGQDCKPGNYAGYFAEFSGGYGLGGGADIGLNKNRYYLPTGPSGVNEVGGGGTSPGASALLCYYYFVMKLS